MPRWVDEGIADYCKRIHIVEIQIQAVASIKRSAPQTPVQAMAQECQKLLARLRPTTYTIALDERGPHITSHALAVKLKRWMDERQAVAFLIGGSDGLTEDCKQVADEIWSLSAMTLPHSLARLILVEQLYRACTIIQNHPYHRE